MTKTFHNELKKSRNKVVPNLSIVEKHKLIVEQGNIIHSSF